MDGHPGTWVHPATSLDNLFPVCACVVVLSICLFQVHWCIVCLLIFFWFGFGKLAKPSSQMVLESILGIRNQSLLVLRLSHTQCGSRHDT